MKNFSYNSYKTFFRAISNETRFGIIEVLRKGPKNVKKLCEETNFEQSRVSHNLKRLEKCGFVGCRFEGKHRVYYLVKEINLILENIDKYISKYGKRFNVCYVNLIK